MGAVIAEPELPRIHGSGNLEADWARSPWLQALPAQPAQDWLAGIERLVVVSPHPDDEVLGCGGLMHVARTMGIAVRVVAVTDGEACYPGSRRWTPAQLRRTRRRELAAALGCLDVALADITTLDLGDGDVARHETAVSDALCDLLRGRDRVLTTWRHDGHPDHEATARAAEAAAMACGVPMAQFPVWAWHWMDTTGETPALPGALRCTLPDAAQAAKRRALACFASQFDSGDPAMAPILPPQVRARFERGFEVVLP